LQLSVERVPSSARNHRFRSRVESALRTETKKSKSDSSLHCAQ
jgi:hypothetical protein